jgi:hypothetical protein
MNRTNGVRPMSLVCVASIILPLHFHITPVATNVSWWQGCTGFLQIWLYRYRHMSVGLSFSGFRRWFSLDAALVITEDVNEMCVAILHISRSWYACHRCFVFRNDVSQKRKQYDLFSNVIMALKATPHKNRKMEIKLYNWTAVTLKLWLVR